MAEDKEYGIANVEDVRLLFPNQYLSTPDLRGREVTLTIDKVALRDLRTSDGGKKRRAVVHFAEMKKRPEHERKILVLNKTNAMAIVQAHGITAPRKWSGLRITLFPTRCMAFGEMKDCIRVRPEPPAAKSAQPREAGDETDENPNPLE